MKRITKVKKILKDHMHTPFIQKKSAHHFVHLSSYIPLTQPTLNP